MVNSSDIADLEVVAVDGLPKPKSNNVTIQLESLPPSSVPTLPAAIPPTQQSQARAGHATAALRFVPSSIVRPKPAARPAPPETVSSSNFVDPAILSFGRTPSLTRPFILYPTREAVSDNVSMPAVHAPHPAPPTTSAGHLSGQDPKAANKIYDYLVVNNDTHEVEEEEVTVIEAGSRRDSKIIEAAQPTHLAPGQLNTISKKKGRTRQNKQSAGLGIEAVSADQPHSSPEINRAEPKKQAPLLQSQRGIDRPAHVPSSLQAVEIVTLVPPKRKQGKKMRQKDRAKFEAQSGWATEDATDVQGMDEFDFAQNLANFDKKEIFKQLAAEDDTAVEERLVHFNRLQKPGTFGGTKLHPSENVLDIARRVHGQEESNDSDEDYAALASSQLSIRSRAASTKVLSRKDSKMIEAYMSPPSGTGTISRVPRAMSIIKSPNHVSFDSDSRMASPVPIAPQVTLRYSNINRSCPVATPETCAAIEKLALTQFDMTPDLLVENAGRSIASVVLLAINPGGQRLSATNHNARPVIVVLAGNHTNGACAIAAARHLAERGVRIIITSPAVHRTHHQDVLVSQVRRLGGARDILRTWTATSAYLKTLDAPPELIIDALSDRLSSPFTSLSPEPLRPNLNDDLLDASSSSPPDNAHEIATAIAMMTWANQSAASVLALDRPSGIDATSGLVEVWEGEPAEVRSRIVVALGAPSLGLVRAMRLRTQTVAEVGAEGIGSGVQWKVFVADVGLGPAGRAWCAGEGRVGGAVKEREMERWVRFGADWSVGVELAAATAATDLAGLGLGVERRGSRRSLGGLGAEVYDAYD